jgi:hypothetical protein
MGRSRIGPRREAPSRRHRPMAPGRRRWGTVASIRLVTRTPCPRGLPAWADTGSAPASGRLALHGGAPAAPTSRVPPCPLVQFLGEGVTNRLRSSVRMIEGRKPTRRAGLVQVLPSFWRTGWRCETTAAGGVPAPVWRRSRVARRATAAGHDSVVMAGQARDRWPDSARGASSSRCCVFAVTVVCRGRRCRSESRRRFNRRDGPSRKRSRVVVQQRRPVRQRSHEGRRHRQTPARRTLDHQDTAGEAPATSP